MNEEIGALLVKQLVAAVHAAMIPALDSLPGDVAAVAAAGVTAGGGIETRVLLRPGHEPRIAFWLHGPGGQIELTSGGGEPL